VLGDVNTMSQAYQIRRRGQLYLAPNRASLIAWIHQGRVRLDDEVRPHEPAEAPWRRFEDEPSLKALFPYQECHMVRRGERVFKAHELSLICEWARAGKVALSDEVYVPQERAWRLASSIPALCDAVAQHKARRRSARERVTDLSAEQVRQLTAPLYDLARLYLVYQSLPPGSPLPSASRLMSLNLELTGAVGRQPFERALHALHAHHQALLSLEKAVSGLRSGQHDALKALIEASSRLLQMLMSQLSALGMPSPERLVVGSEPEALRHPTEREALASIEGGLREAISCAARLRRISERA